MASTDSDCLGFLIIALDATFMNVSISQVVADLNTDVSTIQMTMSFYTLITAAFMLLSAKLQDIVGKKKLFLIGAALYGVGTFTAAVSTSSTMLFISKPHLMLSHLLKIYVTINNLF